MIRRFIPRTLTSQLYALVIGAIIATQTICVSFLTDEREHAITEAFARTSIQQLLRLADQLDASGSEERAKELIAAANIGLAAKVALDSVPSGHQNLAEAGALFRSDHPEIQYPRDRATLISTEIDVAWSSHAADEVPAPHILGVMHSSVQLKDGRWLNGATVIPEPPFRWSWYGLISIALITLILLSVTGFLVTRVSGPLRHLARTASMVSEREHLVHMDGRCPHELKPLTYAFNDMVRRLTLLLRERSQMLAAIAHDLRSPITAMRIRVEMLEDVSVQERLSACLDEIEVLVQGALMLSKGTDTGEATTLFKLNDLIDEIQFEFNECEKPVSFELAPTYTVLGRRMALKRSLRNLIDNAIRYGGFAHVTCWAQNDTIVVSIADGGPGIPSEYSERIFEPFVRLESSRSRDTGGTGLGMTIAKSIFISHGGTVEFGRNDKEQFAILVSLPILQLAIAA